MPEPLAGTPGSRSTPVQLQQARDLLQTVPWLETMLSGTDALLAVLDERRHVLAVNQSLLQTLGLNTHQLFGDARAGELALCDHAHDDDQGCGESAFCQTCGLTQTIRESQRTGRPTHGEWLLSALGPDGPHSFEFQVRATPFQIHDHQLTLISLLDLRDQKRRLALQRAFFHDVLNTLSALSGNIELQHELDHDCPRTATINRLLDRLGREITEQRDFILLERGDYPTHLAPVTTDQIWLDLGSVFRNHALCEGRTLSLLPPAGVPTLLTDRTLVERVLTNMIKNALEASHPGETITVQAEAHPAAIRFSVHNPDFIPPAIAQRIFQRFFTTHDGPGRGLGTWGMKLIGQQVLGGEVDFETSPEEGTRFTLTLPLGASVPTAR